MEYGFFFLFDTVGFEADASGDGVSSNVRLLVSSSLSNESSLAASDPCRRE